MIASHCLLRNTGLEWVAKRFLGLVVQAGIRDGHYFNKTIDNIVMGHRLWFMHFRALVLRSMVL